MTVGDGRALLIGAWRVDPTTDEISCGAEIHKLEPRTMRLLLYLAARPGQVVDMHRLLDEVWSGVIVTPGSVYQAIAQLRRLLGDQAEHPTYIDTHSRKGYRLVANVSPW
jgi:DNA-binding winged helix-turn-helix (wHTH) protein